MTQPYESRELRIEQIAEAALTVIAESGLRRFTTNAIAEKVGITDGTIFRHFKNKEEIVLAAMDRLEARMFANGFPKDSDPLVRLENFFRERAALLGGDAFVGQLAFSDQLVHAAGEVGRKKLAGWRKRNMAFVTKCLKELESSDRLPPNTRADSLLVVVQGVLLTFSLERMLVGKEIPRLRARIDSCWQTLAHLLAP